MNSKGELEESDLLDAVNGIGQVSAGLLGADSASASVSETGKVEPVDLLDDTREDSATAKALEARPTQVLQKLSGMCSHAKQLFLQTAPESEGAKWAHGQHAALKELVPSIIQAISKSHTRHQVIL